MRKSGPGTQQLARFNLDDEKSFVLWEREEST